MNKVHLLKLLHAIEQVNSSYLRRVKYHILLSKELVKHTHWTQRSTVQLMEKRPNPELLWLVQCSELLINYDLHEGINWIKSDSCDRKQTNKQTYSEKIIKPYSNFILWICRKK